VLGQGTWHLELADRSGAITALRRGLDLGLAHVDTAEMYGDGAVETLLGEALAGRSGEIVAGCGGNSSLAGGNTDAALPPLADDGHEDEVPDAGLDGHVDHVRVRGVAIGERLRRREHDLLDAAPGEYRKRARSAELRRENREVGDSELAGAAK